MARTSREVDPQNRRAFRRVQALACLTELLSLRSGVFRFKKLEEPLNELAGVDMMVMTHLVPPLPGRLRSWFFTRGLEKGDVDVVVGEDGMHFRLPADSEAIEQETLGS